MDTEYRLVRRLSNGLAVLSSEFDRQQLWSVGKIRQVQPCQICQRDYQVGSAMFRPITNYDNRGHRICVTCISNTK